MSKEQIEGNFLISVFNGWTYENVKDFSKDITSNELHNYHEDWNKLMMAVDKIIDIDVTPAPNWSGYRIEIVQIGRAHV